MFLSARVDFADQAEAIRRGAVDYLGKPFDPLALAPRLTSIYDRVARGEAAQLRHEKLSELRALGV